MISITHNCFADPGESKLHSILKKRVAKEVSVKDKKVVIKTKEKGAKFVLKKGDSTEVLNYSQKKEILLGEEVIMLYSRHYSIKIYRSKGSEDAYIIEEREDRRSLNESLTCLLFEFKIDQGKVVKISEKVEDETAMRQRIRSEE